VSTADKEGDSALSLEKAPPEPAIVRVSPPAASRREEDGPTICEMQDENEATRENPGLEIL